MPSYSTYDDAQLLQLLKAGDEAAFNVLYDRYRTFVYKYALRICHQSEAAEEIVQNVLLKAWQQRGRHDAALNFKGWIARVTANEAFDFLKRLAKDKALKEAVWLHMQEAPAYTEDQYVLKEYLVLIEEAVRSLPARQQQIYRLSREQCLTHEQIAEQLQISSHTVKNQMSTALSHIRKYLTDRNSGALPSAIVICLFCLI